MACSFQVTEYWQNSCDTILLISKICPGHARELKERVTVETVKTKLEGRALRRISPIEDILLFYE